MPQPGGEPGWAAPILLGSMTDQVLINRARDIYDPFEVVEAMHLLEYCDTVESLLKQEAIKSTWSWKIEVRDGGGTSVEELDYAGEDALHDFAGRFRMLYSHKEPMSFDAMRALLHRHVASHESPLQQQALTELRTLGKMKKEALKSPLTARMNGKELTSHDIIDLHLSGRYLHRDPEKAAQLANASVLVRAEFLELVARLTHVFKVGRAVVDAILAESSLLPPPA
jgi:hypothetical protein